MTLNAWGIGSAVFLALYALLFIYLVTNYITRRFKFKSRWTLLLFHVTIRLAAQGVGIGFAIEGFSATSLLIADLILSAEGYFSLMMCQVRLLISWQRRYTPERHSWLAGPKNAPELSVARRIFEGLSLIGLARSPINAFHWLLIVANALIITGGSLLGGGTNSVLDNWSTNSDLITTCKSLRGAGQGIFLCLTLFIFGCIFRSLRRCYSAEATADERRTRKVLVVMACSFPFMLCRGIFGLLQAVINSLNYYYPGIYQADGFTTEFSVKEICCATMCEWITCTLLLSTSLLGLGGKGSDDKAVGSSSGQTTAADNQSEVDYKENKVNSIA